MLLNNVDYIAACAEDVWFDELETASRISERIGRKGSHGHYQTRTMALNANDLADYIVDHAAKDPTRGTEYLVRDSGKLEQILSDIKKIVRNSLRDLGYGDAWNGAAKRYPPGCICHGTIINIKDFGVFVQLEPGIVGLIPRKDVEAWYSNGRQFLVRESKIRIRINKVDEKEFRIDMRLT